MYSVKFFLEFERILLQSVSIQHLAVSLMQQRPGQRSGREQGAMNGERRERERERDKRGGIFYYVTSEMDYSR